MHAPRCRALAGVSTEHLGADPSGIGETRSRRDAQRVRMRYWTRARAGLTLVELCLVVTIIGLVMLLGVRQLGLYVDRAASHAAVLEAAGFVARARDEAIARRMLVSVRLDTIADALELRMQGAVVSRAALGHAHGVALSANRDSLTYDVRGLGYGAANLTLVARRGRAADSLVVSRLGRLRW
jgi:type II secretory pathway pseudopilin PulG